jgi:choline-sulfatase
MPRRAGRASGGPRGQWQTRGWQGAAYAALALVTALLTAACGRSAERVVLVSIDTLRADYVGAYGAEGAHTPTLDGLAAKGVRFATAVAPTPLTLPSHSTMLTGLDPPRHGVRNNSTFRLPEDVPTLAERLRAHGFATAAFIGAVVLDRHFGLARGFDVYDDAMGGRHAAGEHGFAERRAGEVVDAALAWLETAPSRFLLWIHLYDPHANYDPPPGFLASFPGNPYAGEIAYADAELGRLLAAIDRRFPDGRTLVFATSDHGESLGEHGELTHSLTLYDATQRVPMLARGPSLPAGVVVEPQVTLADITPTLLALVGAPPIEDLDGRDLRPLLDGATRTGRPAYLETIAPQVDFGWSPLLGIRTERFKYVRAPRPELYDLEADPREARNLLEEADSSPEATEVQAELSAVLDARLARARPPARTEAPGAERRRELEALGYLVGDVHRPLELGAVGGVDPKDGLALVHTLMQAVQHMAWDRPEEALALLAPLEGGGYVVDSHRSEAARLAGDAEAAERYARAALAWDARVPSSHVALGEALEAQGRREAAGQAFEAAASLAPSLAEPLVGLGRIAEARGQREEAILRYQAALEQRTGSTEARWRLAALALEAGDEARASVLLAHVPEKDLLRPPAVLRLADADRRRGRHAEALARLRSGLEVRPGSRRLQRALAELEAG